MKQLIIDAKDLIVGRMATFAAKQALLGATIVVVNAEQAVFTKSTKAMAEIFLTLRENGTPFKGPFIIRNPDRVVRRIIRGMIPHHHTRGREAYARVMCYMGVPDEFKDKKLIRVDYAEKKNSHAIRFTTVLDVCRAIGAHR